MVNAPCRDRDLLRGASCWLLWGLPAAMVVVGAVWAPGRAWLWSLGLALAGAACLANARRCGRRHCYLTGPVFLLGALAAALHGGGWHGASWGAILDFVVMGALLGCAWECLQGRYARTP